LKLGHKIALWVVLISGIFTIFTSIIQLYLDYKSYMRNIEKTLDIVASSHIHSLEYDVWNLDKNNIETELEELLRLPDISHVQLSETKYIHMEKGLLPEKQYQHSKTYTLSAVNHNNSGQKIGVLKVTVSLKNVFSTLAGKIVFILISHAIKTFFVSFFMLFMIHALITRHIETISHYFKSMSPGKIPKKLILKKNKQFMPFQTVHEIDLLVSRINSMQESLTQRQSELIREKERLQVTLRSIGDGVITTDTGGKITMINKVAEQLTGWKQIQAKGIDIKEVFHIIDVATGAVCENPVQKALETSGIVEMNTKTILVSRNGMKRLINDSAAPIFDENSQIIGVVLVFRDITEKSRMEQHLQHAQKMDAISTLAGGIAHDFNNMLSVITGNISNALSDLSSDHELFDLLSETYEGSRKAAFLTQQLLTFSKGGAPIKQVANINQLIQESANFVISGAKTRLKFELEPQLLLAEIDVGQFNQVVGNLVINANQAMSQGGTIRIKTENYLFEDKNKFALSSGQYIKISVRDQGIGIPENQIQHVFEPFYSTKEKGHGLGLAISYAIIKKHGGHMSVKSTYGDGATFNIYLPATNKKSAERINKKSESYHGQGHILILDDQMAILKMVAKMLKTMGYESTCTTDGIQTIDAYKKAFHSGKAYDLVILDLTIPGGMGGAKTITELVKIDPNVKAVVSSGYANDSIMANYQKFGFWGVVPKPYSKSQLAELLSRL